MLTVDCAAPGALARVAELVDVVEAVGEADPLVLV